jgi:outer membrane protein OmpA-like peptidoglycan-associated protein
LVAAAAGAVAFGMFLWWWQTKLSGLRGMFEIPWFGVGDDVESASLLESALRAAMFIVTVWLILAAVAAPFLLVLGEDIFEHPLVTPTKVDGPEHTNVPPSTSDGTAVRSILAELKTVNSNLVVLKGALEAQQQRLAAFGRTESADAAISDSLKRQEQKLDTLNESLGKQAPNLARLGQIEGHLAAIRDTLAKQDGRLASLETIRDKLREWDPGRGPEASTVASLLEETRRANSGLDQLRLRLADIGRQLNLLNLIEQRLARWDPDKASPDATVASIFEQARMTNAKLGDVLQRLDKIHGVLADGRKGRTSTEDCVDYAASLDPQNSAASASSGSTTRFRTIDIRQVFFDRGSSVLSDWAKQDLSWFLDEARIPDGKLAIYGSTDPQGSGALNARLARERVKAIHDYVLDDARRRGEPPQEVISVRSGGGSGAPKSEPYKRVTYIRLLQPCQ